MAFRARVAITVIGVANGVLDVSMNIHGLIVERQLGRPILSTLHAAARRRSRLRARRAVRGFAAMGLGLAALFPLALRAAATRGPVAGPSVAAVSALGYLGLLTGPPVVGGLSEAVGLRAALVLVVALLAVAALLAGSLRAPSGTA